MVEMIMSLDEAKRNFETINQELGVFDINKICPVGKEESNNETSAFETRILQGIACGLIYWDNEKKCIVQKLVKKVLTGTIEAEELCYKEPIKMKMQSHLVKGEIEILIAKMTNRSSALIGELFVFDASIAMAIVKTFFGE